MQLRTRRFFFYSLAVIFAAASPVLVLYALGYTYDFSRAQFAATGGIFVKSNTSRVSIFLDNEFVKETGFIIGSALLTDVHPGSHLLRLEKGGFHAWSKTVGVEPSLVTEFRSVVLVADPVPVATTTSEDISRVMASTTMPLGITLDRTGNLIHSDDQKHGLIAGNVHSYAPTRDAVFFIDKNGFFARYDRALGSIQTIGRPGFYITGKPMMFFPSPSGNFVAVVDPSGGLFLFREETREIHPAGGGVRAAAFDREEQKMLIRKDRSIDVMWLKENRYQPFQKTGQTETVMALKEPIKDAVWFYKDNAHMAVRTLDAVVFTELDGRGARNTFELFSGPTSALISSPSAPEAIFFRTKTGSFRIEL